MQDKRSIRQGNRLDIEFQASSRSSEPYEVIKSREYVINGLVVFQIKLIISKFYNSNNYSSFKHNGLLNITLCKALKSDILTYAVKCSIEELSIQNNSLVEGPVTFFTDDTSWRQIYEYSKINQTSLNFTFRLTLELDLQTSPSSPLASLINDTDLTDFELRGKDGSVHVHKVILAGYSTVLQKLVTGDWREAKEGIVNVEGTTKETLQHLKDYMYNDKLPEIGLEQLMDLSKLASCYMMEDLVQKCSFYVLTKLSAQNGLELAKFAAQYELTHLFLAIIKHVECGYIKVKDIEDIPQVEKAAKSDEELA